MKGDFSRDSFDADRRYGGVLFQQGRVQLDSDQNENVAIHRQLSRSIVRDLIGAHGGPDSCLGFECIASQSAYREWWGRQSGDRDSSSSDFSNDMDWQHDFLLTPGHYYVGGVLLENQTIARYSDHADPGTRGLLNDRQDVVVFLEAFERVVTALDDPGLLEPALAGADTTVRVKVDWQIRLDWFPSELTSEPDGRACPPRRYGLLTARTRPPETPDDSKGGYTGAESRLYRIEIHAGSDTGIPTFKWSRENGAVVRGVVDSVLRPTNERLTLQLVPVVGITKYASGIESGAWVELLPAFDPGPFRQGPLLRVNGVNSNGSSLDLDTKGQQVEAAGIRVIRRWDQRGRPIAILADGQPIPIEEGIEIVFDPPTRDNLRAGDYWLIPARPSTGDIEWARAPDPQGGSTRPLPRPPNGPWSDRAPIAVLSKLAGENRWITEDLRRRFTTMAR